MGKEDIMYGFLHQHPRMQERLNLDEGHVIVDKKDWEEVRGVNQEVKQPTPREDFLKAAEVELKEDCYCSDDFVNVENIDVIEDVCKKSFMQCANWAFDQLHGKTKNQD